MKKSEIFPILFWIALSLFVMFFSCRMGLSTFRTPGPGLMPFLLGVSLLLVSVYFLASSLLKGRRANPEANPGERPAITLWKVAVVVVSLVVYALLLDRLGYLIATPLLLFLLFWVAGSRKLSAVISSVVTVLLSYFAFTYLGLRFPPGLLKYLGL